ncbi:MAG: hypothetical protein ACK41D_11855, partial [Rubricoccaceae bacterium]
GNPSKEIPRRKSLEGNPSKEIPRKRLLKRDSSKAGGPDRTLSGPLRPASRARVVVPPDSAACGAGRGLGTIEYRDGKVKKV